MSGWMIFLGAWFVLSVPVSVLLGLFIQGGHVLAECEADNGEEQ